MKAISPEGTQIVAAFEVVNCEVPITFQEPGTNNPVAITEGKLSFEYDGGSNVLWDGQRPVRDIEGKRIFIDEDGEQWTEDQITLASDTKNEQKEA